MHNISLPQKVSEEKIDKPNSSLVIVEPCFPGYGITIGNALRRVMLSSLPGAAVTSVKIKGAQHEFMPLENVKEDVLEIILNLKLLRLKVFDENPVILNLKVHGEKKVTAADIEKNSQVEIKNEKLAIATLTHKNAELEMEITVENGLGYLPTEARDEKEKLPIGTIAVDALFSPVVNVGTRVENVRVGQMTNWDKLILDVETDGTISPREALDKAAQILVDQFTSVVSGGVTVPEEKPELEGKDEEVKELTEEAGVKSGEEVGVESPAVKEKEANNEKDSEKEEKPKKRGRPKKKKE